MLKNYKLLLTIFTVLLLVAPFFVFADELPPLPMAFYGAAKLNTTTNLPSGITIKAYYGTSPTTSSGQITTTAAGKYGASDPTNYNAWADTPLIVNQGTGIIYFKAVIPGYNNNQECTASPTEPAFASGITKDWT